MSNNFYFIHDPQYIFLQNTSLRNNINTENNQNNEKNVIYVRFNGDFKGKYLHALNYFRIKTK